MRGRRTGEGEAGHPHRRCRWGEVRRRPVFQRGDRVAYNGAGSLVHAPAPEKAAARSNFGIFGRIDVPRRTGHVPDARLVQDTVEEPGGCWVRPCRGHGYPETSMLNAVRTGRAEPGEGDLAILDAVQVEREQAAVVGGRGVVPDVVHDRGGTGDRMVQTRVSGASAFLEISTDLAGSGSGAVQSEEVVHVNGATPRRVIFAAAFSDQRDGHSYPACAGRRGRAGPLLLEPGLNCKVGGAQARRSAEGHVVVRAVEVERCAGVSRPRPLAGRERERADQNGRDPAAPGRRGRRWRSGRLRESGRSFLLVLCISAYLTCKLSRPRSRPIPSAPALLI